MLKFGQDEIDAVVRVLNEKKLFRYLDGAEEAYLFERELCEQLRVSHSILLSSGTAALICGLAAMEIGPGDEVIIPGYTFVATALAPLALGALPVICEIDETLTIDPEDVLKKISPKTRAIIPVHMNGFPSNMEALLEIARANNLVVLEDACQAIGGSYKGRFLGTIGDMGGFSFNQFKIITAGEGGAIVTNDKRLYERAFIQHDGSCGISPFVDSIKEPLFAGWAFRASEITAAILRVQLQKLDGILSELREQKIIITKKLAEISRVKQAPCHDVEGECATHIAYQFQTSEEAREFCYLADEAGFNSYLASESWHIYSDWSMVLDGRGAHHSLRNPFIQTERVYHKYLCPQTLNILSRTALLRCDLNMSQDILDRFIKISRGKFQ